MQEFLFAVHHPEDQGVPDDLEDIFAAVDVFNTDLMAEARMPYAGGLQPTATAKVVRAQGASANTTDGPMNPGLAEPMGGFWVVRAEGMDEALALAARAVRACRAAVEVRPFQVEPE